MLATPLAAQDEAADEGFSETIDVELVNVDVWVTDRAGEPVRGLPSSAFRVTHDGEPVELELFTELGPETSTPSLPDAPEEAETDRPPARQDSDYLVLYVDQLRIENRDYASILETFRPLLENPALVPEHVLIVRQDRGLFVEANLGSSRQELLAAVDRLGTSNVSGLQASAELEQALDSLKREWRQSRDQAERRGAAISSIPSQSTTDGARGAIGGAGAGSFGPDACDIFAQRVGPTIDGWARSQAQRTAISLDFLSRTATFLAGLPGVKTVLYASGGLETHPGASLVDYVTGLCPGGETLFAIDNVGEEMSASFFELTRHFNSNRVTVYPLQSGYLRTSSNASAAASGDAGATDSFRARGSFEQRQRSEALGGLGLLAEETGGRILTQKDQTAALAERLTSRYSLAYAPPATRGTEMRVDVEVETAAGQDPLRVRHRRSFLEKTPDQRLAELVEGALYLGLVENRLGLRLGAGEMQPEGEAWRLPLRIRVPADRLTFAPEPAAPKAGVKLLVVARHLESGRLASAERALRITGPAQDGALADLPVDLELDPGPTSIAVGLRDELSGAVSVVSTALEVGPPR